MRSDGAVIQPRGDIVDHPVETCNQVCSSNCATGRDFPVMGRNRLEVESLGDVLISGRMKTSASEGSYVSNFSVVHRTLQILLVREHEQGGSRQTLYKNG